MSSTTKFLSQVSHAMGAHATSPRPLTPVAKKLGPVPVPVSVPVPMSVPAPVPPPEAVKPVERPLERPIESPKPDQSQMSMPAQQASLVTDMSNPKCTECEKLIV